MLRRFIQNYRPRHRNRVNQVLHVVGIPLSFVVAPAAALGGAAWYWHVGCFVGGYLLQFAGHAVEGNDAGEVVFVKKLLGMPYTEYSPVSNSSSGSEAPDDINSAAR
ncbi:MAG: DUF962 domain-containing protein [Fuerstiella sp.]